MQSSTGSATRLRIAAHGRRVVAIWLAQLPADGWTGTATELSDELGLIADALGPSHYPPGSNSALRRLLEHAGHEPGWAVATKRTPSARLIRVRPTSERQR
ncbi:MAG: hypothetical protein U0871_07470 [Gemmataceae bacterium]